MFNMAQSKSQRFGDLKSNVQMNRAGKVGQNLYLKIVVFDDKKRY